jgi:hypothetical protein
MRVTLDFADAGGKSGSHSVLIIGRCTEDLHRFAQNALCCPIGQPVDRTALGAACRSIEWLCDRW